LLPRRFPRASPEKATSQLRGLHTTSLTRNTPETRRPSISASFPQKARFSGTEGIDRRPDTRSDQMPKLTKRTIDAIRPDPGRDVFHWDTGDGALKGFGVRMKPSGVATWLVQYRTPQGQTRRLALGRVGVLTPDQARGKARDALKAVADGGDPSADRHTTRSAISVADLCEEYMQAARASLVKTRFGQSKSPATVAIDDGRINRHIVPLIGSTPARDLRRSDVQRMVDAIAGGKTAVVAKGKPRGKAVVTGGAGTAAKAVGLLGGIFTWAQRRGHVPEGANPAHGVEKAASKMKDRVLSDGELRALGKALEGRADDQPAAVAALRLIALTGLRREEACGLRWREVDELGQSLRLEDTKTGRSTRPIGTAAMDVLRAVPRRDGVEWLFPRADGTAPADLKKRIAGLFDAAGLKDARSHDLRRTFASTAADLGYGDATIAELLGHARRGVTERHYVRRSDPVLIAAADRVAARLGGMMTNEAPAENVVELRAAEAG
jgi:integrase